jgi:predicted amidohydrolase
VSLFRIGYVQARPKFGRTAENLERALALAARTPADLIVIPELWSTGYVFSSRREAGALAEDPRDGATARALRAAARREKRHYVSGFAERAGGRLYNSAMLVGPNGVRSVYRKLHLFERERDWFSPGDLPLGVHRVGPARVGMMICFDWCFPEVARSLALMGADVLAHPSNLVYPRNGQRAMLIRSLENRVFTVTANRTGRDVRPIGTLSFTGRSQITDPRGEALIRSGPSAEEARAATCDLALARDKSLTRRTHLFHSRRPSFYRCVVASRP